MKLIVGLGNPGDEYANTRHNVGFMVVDKLAHELGPTTPSWEKSAKHQAFTAKVGDVLLVKPTTFMNNSGEAVQSLLAFYKLKPGDVWVVHDDIDLPLGKIRIREKGGTAGHNGVNSILHHIKSDIFVRFRLGVGRGKESDGRNENKTTRHQSVIDFVLSKFTWHEAGKLKHLVKQGHEAVRIALTEGVDKAMNQYN